jgi:hypothetical protein
VGFIIFHIIFFIYALVVVIFCGILSVLQNIVMDMNNVVQGFLEYSNIILLRKCIITCKSRVWGLGFRAWEQA